MGSPFLLVLALLPRQGDPPGASPPPDQYDCEHDRRLFELWGGHEVAAGPFDSNLPPQADALRPADWRVVDGDPRDERAFLLDAARRAASWSEREGGRVARMPARGPLEGPLLVAAARVDVAAAAVRFVRAPGTEIVFVNGEGFAGDPERRGWLGVPVRLRAGENRIVAAGIRTGFELELWQPMTRLVMASWAVSAGLEGSVQDVMETLDVPVFNASLTEAKDFHFHYDHAVDRGKQPSLSEYADNGYGVPLGILCGSSFLFDLQRVPHGPDVLVPLATFDPMDRHGERRLLPIRLERPGPSWPMRDEPVWPPEGTGILVLERTGDPGLDEALLAIARFAQQRLWERGGQLAPLFSEEWFFSERSRWYREQAASIVRIGCQDSGATAGLWAGPEASLEGTSRPTYALRASTPTGARLAYSVEPFFGGVAPDGESWSAP